MGALGWALLALAGLLAAADWVAVATGRRQLEYVCKPLAMVALVAVALAIHPAVPAQRAWWLVALVFGLAGDVFLMLPRDRFVAGLAAFLLGHLAHITGFHAAGATISTTLVWLVVVLIPVSAALVLILRGAVRAGQRQMAVPIAVYAIVISAMVASALSCGGKLAAGGAILFIASDGLIGFRRFVSNQPWMGLAVIVTYHLGQAALVLSLVR
jgi:uncharacterized membrane protein YhhN